MNTREYRSWNDFYEKHQEAHILQSCRWGELKERYGWKPRRIVNDGCGAQILFRKMPFGFSIGYIPKGPVGIITSKYFEELDAVCKSENAIVLFIEPDQPVDEFNAGPYIQNQFQKSNIQFQPHRTIEVSLKGSQEEWLGRMKQKTRYNIRLAKKKEIVVESSHDICEFNNLMAITGERDAFGVHDPSYYKTVFKLFQQTGNCRLLIAKYRRESLAAILVFKRGSRAWYFYGASSNIERNRMPTYLLQWEGMKWAAKSGCTSYDLWGIPDDEESVLEEDFLKRGDGLWGVYRFKRGFGGEVVQSAHTYQKIYRPGLFSIFSFLLKIRRRSFG